MTRSRSKFGRFVDHMRRNVLSYKYLRHNILMTALVVVMALCVFAVISFGEKADPLADELYANDSVTINKSQAVMMADSSLPSTQWCLQEVQYRPTIRPELPAMHQVVYSL